MKKILLFLVSLAIGILLFSWVLKITSWQEIKNSLRIFSGRYGLLVVVLTFLMAIIGTWKWQEILKGQKVKISFFRLSLPYLAGYALMFLIPVMVWGGEVLRGYLLKRQNSVPWSKGMASIIIDRVFEWTANLLVIVIGILFFLSKIYMIPKNLEVLFGFLFLLFVLFIIYFYLKAFKKESIVQSIAGWFGLKQIEERKTLLETEKEIFDFFEVKNKRMWTSLALSFLRVLVMLARVWLIIFFLGKKIFLSQALSILGFNYLASMIPIPAALGSHEAIQTLAFSEFGLGAANATAFTMIVRGAEMIISLVGVVVLFRFGVEFVKKLLFKDKIEKVADR
jgi:glycosyltransferase AglD